MLLKILIKYSFSPYSQCCSQQNLFVVDNFFRHFFLSTNIFFFFTQYIVLWTSLFHKVLILWITFRNTLLTLSFFDIIVVFSPWTSFF
ncbi:hypothetical protein SAMN04488574_108100 [Bacillus sp. 71mf]|nr:hypothetical protein SAMN04488574_108100 [Bacillus sp. 71mf]SFT12118.1 hypothetical protein SAMN04488145_1128 [Bacillus sp. 103mf]